MNTLTRPHNRLVTTTVGGHRRLRRAAVSASALVTALYGILALVVRVAEQDPATTDTTWGYYVYLTLAYLVSTVAYAVLDRRAVWVAGAVLQVLVLAAFVAFGIGLLDGSVFEYELLLESTPVWAWAVAITGLQLFLLVVLGYLATLRPAGRHAD